MIELSPPSLADIRAQHADYVKADELFQSLLSQTAQVPEGRIQVLFRYARSFWELRDTRRGYTKAIEAYEEILLLDPQMAAARDGLARAIREREILEGLTGQ